MLREILQRLMQEQETNVPSPKAIGGGGAMKPRQMMPNIPAFQKMPYKQKLPYKPTPGYEDMPEDRGQYGRLFEDNSYSGDGAQMAQRYPNLRFYEDGSFGQRPLSSGLRQLGSMNGGLQGQTFRPQRPNMPIGNQRFGFYEDEINF